MTYLALRFSRYVNGVAMRHGEVSRDMFPQYQVRAITNGVHAATWAAPALAALFDRHIPEWRYDNDFLRYVIGVPADEITAAHKQSKLDLLAAIAKSMGQQLDPDALTIGFARRAATYKRADLLFTDLERLRQISERHGPLQILYAGKSHPHDEGGKEVIRRVFRASAALESPSIRILYVPDYDLTWGGLLTSGVDVWLNTPLPPLEASGTSGMKAALNGVPSLSVLDGWWVEGCLEGTTGWAIGERGSAPQDSAVESRSLYDKLDTAVASLFYREPEKYAAIRRAAIAINGSFFNTERMLQQYVDNAYRLRPSEESRRAASLVGLSEKRGPE